MKIIHVAGARPNFIKIAPLMKAFAASSGVHQRLVHTGQHYDEQMSRVFFEDLGLPRPDVNLEVGSASHAIQTARIMMAFEPLVLHERPDLVMVVGDVNSTLAAALVCAKLHIPVAHVEAGLRSFDWTMPEEINRVVTDRLSELLFTTEPKAQKNLLAEGIAVERIHHVGNVMVDTLLSQVDRARQLKMPERINQHPGEYILVTLHRPSNVDDPARLEIIMSALNELTTERGVIFPIHPRTVRRLEEFDLAHLMKGLTILKPLGYLEFLGLLADAGAVVTDSGGIQEETTVLGVPCLTVRETTERPITVDEGTNRLVKIERAAILEAVATAFSGRAPRPALPLFWDGKAAIRVADRVFQWQRDPQGRRRPS